MICPNCKKQFPNGSLFCDECGAALRASESSEAIERDDGRKHAVRTVSIVAVVAIAAVAIVAIVFVPSFGDRDATQESSDAYEDAGGSTQDGSLEQGSASTSSEEETDLQKVSQSRDAIETYAPGTGTPFWGVWIGASRDEDEANEIARGATNNGLNAEVVRSDDWEELNSETWWCVTAGRYVEENQANIVLSDVVGEGYASAYVKYSGDYIGGSSEAAGAPASEEGALYDCEYFSLVMPASWGEAWRMDKSVIETREAMRKADGSPAENYVYTGTREGAVSSGFYIAVYYFNIPSIPNGAQSFTSSKATAIYVINESLSESEFEDLCASFVAK